jgi:hypothetical protein
MLAVLRNPFKHAERLPDHIRRNCSAARYSRWAKRRLQTLRDGCEDFDEWKSARIFACGNRSFQRQPLKMSPCPQIEDRRLPTFNTFPRFNCKCHIPLIVDCCS